MAVDVKEGVSSTATAKGGFSVQPSDGAPGYFDVLEEYSSLELAQGGGAKVGGTGTLDSNRWRCALLRPNSNPSPSPNPNPDPITKGFRLERVRVRALAFFALSVIQAAPEQLGGFHNRYAPYGFNDIGEAWGIYICIYVWL